MNKQHSTSVAAAVFCLLIVQSALAGSIVGWGSKVVGVDLDGGFAAIATTGGNSLGLKQDGSIVAWGNNYWGA